MNKYIIPILKRIFPTELPKPMGRWRVENNNTQMNHKVDLSNEDNCGPCGQYALSTIECVPFHIESVKPCKTKAKDILNPKDIVEK